MALTYSNVQMTLNLLQPRERFEPSHLQDDKEIQSFPMGHKRSRMTSNYHSRFIADLHHVIKVTRRFIAYLCHVVYLNQTGHCRSAECHFSDSKRLCTTWAMLLNLLIADAPRNMTRPSIERKNRKDRSETVVMANTLNGTVNAFKCTRMMNDRVDDGTGVAYIWILSTLLAQKAFPLELTSMQPT